MPAIKQGLQHLAHANGYHVSRLPAPVESLPVATRRAEPRVCHYEQLFVSHSGDLFPCCYTSVRPDLRIGHLDDPDLMDKIHDFVAPCSLCEVYSLRAASQDTPPRVAGINIETSLACQATCTMCCVESPGWHGTYDYYRSLLRLIERLQPAWLLVQGGEVLVQRKTLAMLDEIKRRWPVIRIELVTNGSAPIRMADAVERLFASVTVSLIGFQPATYRAIMGLPFDRMERFVDELSQRKSIELTLKFLITPSNLHEVPLFLDWAIAKRPARIVIDDAGTGGYVRRDAPFQYWTKMVAGALAGVEATLTKSASELAARGSVVFFTTSARHTLAWSGGWDRMENHERLRGVIRRWM